MNNILTYVFSICLLLTMKVNAQIVGANAFLRSDFIEVGINEGGVYASTEGAPDPYHSGWFYVTSTIIDSTHIDTITVDSVYTYFDEDCLCWLDSTSVSTSYDIEYFTHIDTIDSIQNNLGIIFDSDMDGWESGSPKFWGDVVIPGVAEETFGIEVNGASYFNQGQSLDLLNIPGMHTGWNDIGDTTNSTWEGAIDGESISVKQETLIPDGQLYFMTRVTLTNTGTDTAKNVYYVRNVDTDQESMISGAAATNDIIIYNNPADGQCLVSSEGISLGNDYVMYGSRDERARVSYGGFAVSDDPASDPWKGISPYHLSGSIIGDYSMQISFKIGDLAPLQSTTFSFTYIFSNDESVIEEAMERTAACAVAQDIVATEITNNTALISWTSTFPSTEYRIEWKKISAGVWHAATVAGSTFLLDSLEFCTDYEYRISTLCGDETPSDNFSFKTLCTSDAVEDHALSIVIYPNPANDGCMITVESAVQAPVEIIITDAIGNMIKQEILSNNNSAQYFSLKNIPAGIYTVHIKQGIIESFRQLVITK